MPINWDKNSEEVGLALLDLLNIYHHEYTNGYCVIGPYPNPIFTQKQIMIAWKKAKQAIDNSME